MANQPKKYKKFVATAATATLVASAIVPVASAASFTDVPENNEFAKFIDALTEEGIIKGYSESNTFKPNQTLTRGQVVKMLGRWVESNGVEIPSDWNTKQRFNDVPTNHKDQELVKYASLVADEGVFGGAAGKLMAANNITRQQMAKVLNGAYAAVNGESLVEIAEGVEAVEIPDLDKAGSEFEEMIQALMDLEISSTKSNNFRPLENVTRAQFAKFLYNTINLDPAIVSPYEVKAVNSTTVEVMFENDIKNIDEIDFAIEGLDIKEAVVKQTSKRTAVLTTAEQKGGTEYTVTVDGEKAGTFVGIAAVVPTAIDVNTKSVQGIIGEEVTLTATVKVPEGQSKEGVSVTFNVVNDKSTNEKLEVEAFTNAEGVATYKYTRYYASEDQVAAYATKKSSVVSNGKVYWGSKIQLAVSEITAGNELANQTKKSYKVTGAPNATYYIAIKENLNVAPDKLTDVEVQNNGTINFVTPYELTTGGTEFAKVTTNASGEGTFTIYGSNLTATPIVYAPETTPAGTNATTTELLKYSALDLQAEAKTVKFSQIDRLNVDVVAEGSADSAEYDVIPTTYNRVSTGGRAYTVTVTDKEGKIAPEGTVAYVGFKAGNINGDVYFSTDTKNFTKVVAGDVQAVTVGKNGKASFRVAGKGATTFVKPTVFLNTAGGTNPIGSAVDPIKLDTTDVQKDAEATYFKQAVVVNATLRVEDQYGRVISSTNAGTDAYFVYQSVDQNGFDYKPTTVTPGGTITVFVPVYVNGVLVHYEQKVIQNPEIINSRYVLAFDVTSTFGNAIVKNVAGSSIAPVQNLGNTKTYHVTSDDNGRAVVRVTNEAADTVSVNVTGASNILPTQTAQVTFVNSTIVPDVYSGNVDSYNSIEGTLKFAGKTPVALYGDKIRYTKGTEVIANYDAFIDLLANAVGTVSITRTVGTDGITTFNIYNMSTTGAKPVDTARNTPVVNKTALQTAVNAEIAANLQKADYTDATWEVYATALTHASNVLASTTATQYQVDTALANLTAAKTNLQLVPEPVTEITEAFAYGVTATAAALGVVDTYKVAGTVADAGADEVKLVLTFDNATAPAQTVPVEVEDGKFVWTANGNDFEYSIKSVALVVGETTVGTKNLAPAKTPGN